MRRIDFRVWLPLLSAVLCLAGMSTAGAAASTGVVDQFVARAVSVSGAGDAGRIDIYIHRWSTGEELASLRAPLQSEVPGELLQALRKPRSPMGVILMPGVQGFGARARTRTPRYLLLAGQVVTPQGRRVVVASDQHLGLGEAPLEARQSLSEFNLVDIRLGLDGTGVAKVGTAADVIYSEATKLPEVKDYSTRPVRLTDVKSEKP